MKRFIPFLLITFSVIAMQAQLVITKVDSSYVVNFDDSVANVNPGEFDGSGFTPSPAIGQLNSNTFIVSGLADGVLNYGGTQTGNDFGKGSSPGGVTSGGIYAFDIGGGDMTLGVQPSGADWTPGTFDIRIQNQTDSMITDLMVSYDIYVLNNATRSNSFNFSHSHNDTTFVPELGMDYASPEPADGSPAWVKNQRTITLTGLTIDTMDLYYFRWLGNDISGSGSRDEFGLDNITLKIPVPGDTSCVLINVTSDSIDLCNDNGTDMDISDDFFTADIVVEFEYAPNSGALELFVNGSMMPATSVLVGSLDTDSTHRFQNLTFLADGTASAVLARFTEDTLCTYTNALAVPGVNPCSAEPCAQPGDLILSEFMANPGDVSDSQGEYIELYNRSDDTINLFGYEISDISTNSHIINTSLIIRPEEFLVLGASSSVPNVDYVYSSFSMAQSGDEVFLRCLDSLGPILITGVQYTDDGSVNSGVGLELNCKDNPGPLYGIDDYVFATDIINYDGDADTDFGSPGSFGNTDTANITPTQLQATAENMTIATGVTFSITICATDSTGLIPCVFDEYIVLEQTKGATATIINDSILADNACSIFELSVTDGSMCDTLVFDAHSSLFSLDTVITLFLNDTVHTEGFDNCPTLSWNIVDIDSSSTWVCNAAGYVEINTFGDSTLSEDWLISPAIDLTTHHENSLQFETRERFDGPPIELLYSQDYAGTGDPNLASWAALNFVFDNSQNGAAYSPWLGSGAIELDTIATTSTHFAFRYTTLTDSVADWQVDDILISGCPKICSIDSIIVDSIGLCDPLTGEYMADVIVYYTDPPAQGQLLLSGDAADTVDVTSMSFSPDSSFYRFDDVSFTANGGLKTIIAGFGADTTCQLIESNIVGTDVPSCDGGATVFGGLVINEIWNDISFSDPTCFSNIAFVELLVVASVDEDTTSQLINLQNWIIEPSNDALDPGHIRIKSGCLMEVPVGALVVIYNSNNPPAGITAADEMDADSNLVYLIPSNSTCLEYTTDASYPGTTYVDGNASGCVHAAQLSAFSSTIPYAVETRHPHAFSRAYNSVYDDLMYSPANPFAPAGSSNFTCSNIDDVTTVLHDLSISPGMANNANNADNEKLIDLIRQEAGNVLPLSAPSTPDLDAVNYYHLLTPGLTTDCDVITAPPCLDTLVITGPISVSDTAFAGLLIMTSGDVLINGSAVFSAPEILLNAGFEVPLGAEFSTELIGCSGAGSRLGVYPSQSVILRLKNIMNTTNDRKDE